MRDKLEISCDKLIATKYAKSAKRLNDYILSLLQQILDNRVMDTVTAQDLYTFNRYYDVINQINDELRQLGESEVNIMDDYLKGLYNENSRLLGKDFNLTVVNESAMNRAVYDVWCNDGKTWNERIWGNQSELAQQLQDGIMDCITTGKSTKQLARTIADRYSVGLAYSQRLVRTEMTHVQNQSSADRYKEAGVEKFKVLEFRDNKTCEVCGKHNNQIYLMHDMKEGINCAPFHPNCRGTIIPIVED